MTLYDSNTAEPIRELSAVEEAAYLAWLATDWTHTGAIDGTFAGLPGITVYAM